MRPGVVQADGGGAPASGQQLAHGGLKRLLIEESASWTATRLSLQPNRTPRPAAVVQGNVVHRCSRYAGRGPAGAWPGAGVSGGRPPVPVAGPGRPTVREIPAFRRRAAPGRRVPRRARPQPTLQAAVHWPAVNRQQLPATGRLPCLSRRWSLSRPAERPGSPCRFPRRLPGSGFPARSRKRPGAPLLAAEPAGGRRAPRGPAQPRGWVRRRISHTAGGAAQDPSHNGSNRQKAADAVVRALPPSSLS